MYSNIEIKNFRCFRHFKIDELFRVNLIAGKNGSGKTSLLEAIFLHAGAYNPGLVLNINAFRGMEQIKVERGAWAETPFDLIFYEFNSKLQIEINATFFPKGKRSIFFKVLREKEELKNFSQQISQDNLVRNGLITSMQADQILELEYQEKRNKKGKHFLVLSQSGPPIISPMPSPPLFPCIITADRYKIPEQKFAERFGEIEKQGRKQEVVEILKIVEPRIKDISTIYYADKPILHGNIGLSRMVPLPLMGGGINRLAEFTVNLLKAENGVVLFDEIENGLHSSALEDVWTVIGETAQRNNTQVFATTHSFECIAAAHRAMSKQDKYAFKLHRLDRVDEDIKHVSYSKEGLDAAIEMNFEVR